MKEAEIKELKKIIVLTSAYYGRQLEDAVVKMYASDLDDLPFEQVAAAITSYRRDMKNRVMFLPANIRELLNPTVQSIDLARDTTLRIRHAMSKFGYNNSHAAKEFIGDTGWEIVRRIGGWVYLCQNLGTHVLPETTFFAQCRDAIQSQLNLEKAGLDTTRPTIEQAREQGQIIGFVKKLTQKLSLLGEGKNADGNN